MSEKEKEILEEEEETLDHWQHDHPLALVQTHRGDYCDSCENRFASGEKGYGCSKKCGYTKLLHEECAEMARNICHPLHPQHILIRGYVLWFNDCSICERQILSPKGYYCTNSECKFQIHTRCAQDRGLDDGVVHHPSHPQHELMRLLRRCSFRCDACGIIHKGSSYVCIICQYWIHQKCATLPHTIEREDHDHKLSLSFCVPLEYIKFDFKCDVCFQDLVHKYWIYHCQLCRYVVHIKCAFKKKNKANASHDKSIIRLPTNDVVEELIWPFVVREGGAKKAIPDYDIDEDIVDHEDLNAKFKFHSHKHQLNIISSSRDHHVKEEENSDDEEDYGDIICNGCTTTIFHKSSASSSTLYYYMSCSECEYFLHLACFHLPQKLLSLPLHNKADHKLILISCHKFDFMRNCDVCGVRMNGLFYACRQCDFTIDVKCAALPNTIYHAAHPQHLLKHHDWKDMESNYSWSICAAGCEDDMSISYGDCYVCVSCDFVLHVTCVMLPPSATNRRWDKHHPLPLTYDANLNHPDEFYCDHCERKMNPKMWMYHCRHCDLSFHPICFPAITGYYKNIKFGKQYVNPIACEHPHPLTYQLLTTKRRCDVCRRPAYYRRAFHCVSCNFFICLEGCGREFLLIIPRSIENDV